MDYARKTIQYKDKLYKDITGDDFNSSEIDYLSLNDTTIEKLIKDFKIIYMDYTYLTNINYDSVTKTYKNSNNNSKYS